MAIEDMPITRECAPPKLSDYPHNSHLRYPRPRPPAITRVCQIVRAETLAYYYNTRFALYLTGWVFGDNNKSSCLYLEQLGQRLQDIGSNSRLQVNGLHVIWYKDEMTGWWNEAAELRHFARMRAKLHDLWEVTFEFEEVEYVERETYKFWMSRIKFT